MRPEWIHGEHAWYVARFWPIPMAVPQWFYDSTRRLPCWLWGRLRLAGLVRYVKVEQRGGARLAELVEFNSRGVPLERDDLARIVTALQPCVATLPVRLEVTES